jgi:4-hydroxy-tetrahydrodipicolinate synthase
MSNLPRGVIAAVPTPVNADGKPDTERFLQHCQWALKNGCDGLNVLGSTGEASSFGVEDRLSIMTAAATNLDPSKLMVGTGMTDIATTITLTSHAAELGFAAALVLPPYYYQPVTDEGLYRYFTSLCEATTSTPIPLLLYNYPAMTGIAFSHDLVVRLAETLDGRVCGIKDSSANIPYCRALAEALPGFNVFPSSETCLGSAKADGFAGCISATTNITGPVAGRIWRQDDYPGRDDDAAFIADIRTRVAANPLIPAVKFIVADRNKDINWQQVLPPFAELDNDQKKSLHDISDLMAARA